MMRQYELVDRVVSYEPAADEDLLNRAYIYATKKHGDQKRASGDPYFSHPVEVAGILTDLRLDTASIATALLHDTLEDTDATYGEIQKLFGAEIAALVNGVTSFQSWKCRRRTLLTLKTSASCCLPPLVMFAFCWSNWPTVYTICGRCIS